jgi:hypothetical protein
MGKGKKEQKGKIIKLSEKEQRETEILSQRIMPKTDF